MAELKYPQDVQKVADADENRDPLTGEHGAHPVGVGIGAAAAGAAIGAAMATVAGPIGAVVGAAVGAVAGGLVGKDVAELADPTAEGAWWRENWTTRDYVSPSASYEDYGPAYIYGVEVFVRDPSRSFDELDDDLAAGWQQARGNSRLEWGDARVPARDAWERVRGRGLGGREEAGLRAGSMATLGTRASGLKT
jgi:hypothetical protein